MAKDRARLEKQRVRQKELRERNRALKRPSRDDFARMLLHIAFEENVRSGNFAELERLQDGLVDKLVTQGFDKDQCDLVFEDLVDKYKRGWDFLKKVHLRSGQD